MQSALGLPPSHEAHDRGQPRVQPAPRAASRDSDSNAVALPTAARVLPTHTHAASTVTHQMCAADGIAFLEIAQRSALENIAAYRTLLLAIDSDCCTV